MSSLFDGRPIGVVKAISLDATIHEDLVLTLGKLTMTWQVLETETTLTDLLDASLRDGPQVVARNGKEEAVVVPIEEWRRLQPKDLKSVLLAPFPIIDDMMIPKRGQYRYRKPLKF